MFEQSIPLLCNYYSKLFGVTVRIQGNSAYTNGQVITIPRMNLQDQTVKRLTCAYLAHEAGHVRFTDFSILKILNNKKADQASNCILTQIFNILEDSRIEKLMSTNFIGIYENFDLLNNYFEKEWKDYLKNVNKQSSISLLLSLIQLYVFYKYNQYKNSHERAIRMFEECEKRFTRNYLQDLLSKCKGIFNCTNSQEVMTLSKELLKLLKNIEFSEYELEEIRKDLKDSRTSERYSQYASKKNIALNDMQENARIKFMLSCDVDSKKVTALGDVGRLIENLSIGKSSSSREDLGVLKTNVCQNGDPNFIEEVQINYGFINGLRNKVKSYVEYYKSSEQGRKLNIKKAQFIPIGETSIYKRLEKESGFNTNIQIMVDVSSSMITTDGEENSRAYNACVTALSMALAFEGVENINTQVTYFPATDGEAADALRFGEKAHFYAPRFDQSPRGSTPLAQAMYHCLNNLKIDNKKDRNIWIVITDGMPDSIQNTNAVMQEAEERGIEIYGISIRSEMIKQVFDNCIVVKSSKDLIKNIYPYLNKLFDVKNNKQLKKAA